MIDEKHAIEEIIERWNEGWRTKDPSLATRDYSDDADWTNAFGMQRQGRAEIEALLAQVFALPFVMAASSQVVEQFMRFLHDDVALVWTRVERTGQLKQSGEPLGIRNTSHLRVLVKSDGAWQIVSHLVSDARDLASSEH
jgi:uncharacterized protein (TIGR02246 family)